jgi:ribosome-binding factor A
MDTRRQQKIAQLLQEEFSRILMTDARPFLMGSFVTLTKVNVTSDLSLARFNMSVLGSEKKQEVIDSLSEHKSEIRRVLGNKMRNDLRKIPELEFYLDETLDYVERIGDLFDKIKKEETDIKKNPEIGD